MQALERLANFDLAILDDDTELFLFIYLDDRLRRPLRAPRRLVSLF
jgi:hypothetical protein